MASKPGRNDPCPCGSGKKYKKCCLEKEESEIPRISVADDRLVLPERYPDNEIYEPWIDDQPDEMEVSIQERERWGGLRDRVEQAAPELKAQLAIEIAEQEKDLHPELILILFEAMLDPLMKLGRFEDLAGFLNRMNELYPRQPGDVSAWITKYKAVVEFHRPRGDMIPTLLDLARGDKESVEGVVELAPALVFHNRRKELNAVMPVFWKTVEGSEDLVDQQDRAWKWYLSLELNELIDPSGLTSDQARAIDLVKKLWLDSDEERDYVLSRCLEKVEPRWLPEQFPAHPDVLGMLTFDFALFLYRERGWSFLRAHMASGCIFDYLYERQVEAGQSRKKAKKILHSLRPDPHSADRFVSTDLNEIFPEHYLAAAFFLALKPWLEFLRKLGLVEESLLSGLGEELKQRLRPIYKVLEMVIFDPLMLAEVKARLEETW